MHFARQAQDRAIEKRAGGQGYLRALRAVTNRYAASWRLFSRDPK